MRFTVELLRHPAGSSESFWQEINYKTEDEMETVERMLTRINMLSEQGLKDTSGNDVGYIFWECNCLQKKCGACAMVINGYPSLACDTRIKKFEKRGRITVEPLRKFPVVADFIVDRSILFENLKTMRVWYENAVDIPGEKARDAYESSRCMQCGLCLEVCPNFAPGDDFFGAAAFVPTSRLITTLEEKDREELAKSYVKHIYSGCGKSLACAKICPAGIRIDRLLSSSNLISVWKRGRRGLRRAKKTDEE